MQVFRIKNLRIGLKILLIWLSAGSSWAIIFYKVNLATLAYPVSFYPPIPPYLYAMNFFFQMYLLKFGLSVNRI